jgi:hypothetical protein
MDINEVKAFITENAEKDEVKSFVGELSTISPEKFEKYISETEEGKKLFESKTDGARTQASKTAEARIQKELEAKYKQQLSDEISKLNKGETPSEREAREAKQIAVEERNLRLKSELSGSILDYAYNSDMKQIGTIFADVAKNLLDPTKVAGSGVLLEYLDKINKAYKDDLQEAIKKVKGASASTPAGGDTSVEPNTLDGWNKLIDEYKNDPMTWQRTWSKKYSAWCDRQSKKR